MKPASFEYVRVSSWSDAANVLAADEEARVLAGGQSLVPAMNLRLASPSTLVDIQAIPGSDTVAVSDKFVSVGSRLTHGAAAADRHLDALNPIIAEAAGAIGHPAIRAQGTIGGSLAHADPVAEWPLVATLLRAEILVLGRSGSRIVPAANFVQFVFTTALEPGELITGVRFPRPAAARGGAYEKVARVRGDFARIGVGVVTEQAQNEQHPELRIGVTGLDSKALIWSQPAGSDTFETVAERCTADFAATGCFARSAWLEGRGEGVLRTLIHRTTRRALERMGTC